MAVLQNKRVVKVLRPEINPSRERRLRLPACACLPKLGIAGEKVIVHLEEMNGVSRFNH